MNSKVVKRFVGLFGLLISIGIVWFIIEKYDVESSWQIVKGTPFSFLIIMVLIYLSTFLFRVLRWKLMLLNFHDLGFMLLLKSIILGFAGNNIIPARGGEFLRMEYFSRRTKISRTTSLTSIGLEKILDAIVLLSFLLIASIFVTKTNEYFIYIIQLVSLIFFPIILFLIVLKIKGKQIIKWLGLRNGRLTQFLSKHFVNFHAALSFLKADINTLKILGVSVLIWLLEGFVFVLGMKAIGLNDSVFLMGIIALCIVNFGILIPSSPGYIGIFQAAIIIVLSSFGISETNSLAAAIIIHSCQFFPVTIFGIYLIIKYLISRNYGK